MLCAKTQDHNASLDSQQKQELQGSALPRGGENKKLGCPARVTPHYGPARYLASCETLMCRRPFPRRHFFRSAPGQAGE